jgi:hypothetical protein
MREFVPGILATANAYVQTVTQPRTMRPPPISDFRFRIMLVSPGSDPARLTVAHPLEGKWGYDALK